MEPDFQPISSPCLADPERLDGPATPIPTDSLFRGAQEIQITHKGELYRLRITRNDKLILTK